MSTALPSSSHVQKLPTHLDLPESDGAIVENFLEHLQSVLLTGSIWPVLQQLHPDSHFAVGQDSGIYWKVTDPPLDGCKAPDWFYVPNVPPNLDGQYRRSYVMWQEHVSPLLIIEYVSKDGREERDQTPGKGKFWVYEQAIKAVYYAIYEVDKARVEVYHLEEGRYVRMEANVRGHFEIPELDIEIGLWHAHFRTFTVPWLRFFDSSGRMLPSEDERAAMEQQRAELERSRAAKERERAEREREQAAKERERAEKEWLRAERLAEKLRALGIDPDQA
jgi:Uma2 family endonuclease